ncbi:hypothetical protein KBD45_04785 [Candidatus Dojkabacteria bacterium]|nr:hypothetical protein [Candidatus Dojkabacteria bacterium]
MKAIFNLIILGLGGLLLGGCYTIEIKEKDSVKVSNPTPTPEMHIKIDGKSATPYSLTPVENNEEEKNIGQSFISDGVTITLVEVKRETTNTSTFDGKVYDSKIGFHLKLENKSNVDKYINPLYFQLNSRIKQNEITEIIGGDVYKPEYQGETLIDGAILEGWITYFLPSEIKNTDLRFTYYDYTEKIKFNLE